MPNDNGSSETKSRPSWTCTVALSLVTTLVGGAIGVCLQRYWDVQDRTPVLKTVSTGQDDANVSRHLTLENPSQGTAVVTEIRFEIDDPQLLEEIDRRQHSHLPTRPRVAGDPVGGPVKVNTDEVCFTRGTWSKDGKRYIFRAILDPLLEVKSGTANTFRVSVYNESLGGLSLEGTVVWRYGDGEHRISDVEIVVQQPNLH